MRFTDFLKATVLISGGAASALGVAAIAGAASDQNTTLALVALGWWVVAGAVGAFLGRRGHASPAIARLLADARSSPMLPEIHPGRTLLNRLWPLLILTLASGALAFLTPQVPAIATGFAIIWALAWRRQESAVSAIEDRDGARFYIEQTSPVEPIKLIRTPGFRGVFPSVNGKAKEAPVLRARPR